MNYPPTHTPGPWCWRQLGNTPVLCTQHHGCLIVMDFVRNGMQNAIARMSDRRDCLGGIMHKMELTDLDSHPDARLIRAAPELLAAAEAVLAAGDCLVRFRR